MMAFDVCPTCEGSGRVIIEDPTGVRTSGVMWVDCSTCEGRGRVVSESVIEEMADAMHDLPYDTLELRNWGEESMADPYEKLARAAGRVLLEHMEDT